MNNHHSLSLSQATFFIGALATARYAYLNSSKQEIPRFLLPIGVALFAISLLAELWESGALPLFSRAKPIAPPSETAVATDTVSSPTPKPIKKPPVFTNFQDPTTKLKVPISAVWQSASLSCEEAHEQMVGNLLSTYKGAVKSARHNRFNSQFLASPQEIPPPSFEQVQEDSVSLKFSLTSYSTPGTREGPMQDAFCYQQLDNGAVITAVADGHGSGSSMIAQAVVEIIKQQFPLYLEASQGNALTAFESLIYEIAEPFSDDFRPLGSAKTLFMQKLGSLLEAKQQQYTKANASIRTIEEELPLLKNDINKIQEKTDQMEQIKKQVDLLKETISNIKNTKLTYESDDEMVEEVETKVPPLQVKVNELVEAPYQLEQLEQKLKGFLKELESAKKIFLLESELYEEQEQPRQADTLLTQAGTTLVATYITPQGVVYTATVGDCEAVLCRGDKAIPLSPSHHWGTKEEAIRAAILGQNADLADEWSKCEDPKQILSVNGLNVSRAIGDRTDNHHQLTVQTVDTKEEQQITLQAISSMPTVTVHKALPGDTLVLYSDGVGDYVSPKKTLKKVKEESSLPLAERLATYALKKESQDHITVVAIKVEASAV